MALCYKTTLPTILNRILRSMATASIVSESGTEFVQSVSNGVIEASPDVANLKNAPKSDFALLLTAFADGTIRMPGLWELFLLAIGAVIFLLTYLVFKLIQADCQLR